MKTVEGASERALMPPCVWLLLLPRLDPRMSPVEPTEAGAHADLLLPGSEEEGIMAGSFLTYSQSLTHDRCSKNICGEMKGWEAETEAGSKKCLAAPHAQAAAWQGDQSPFIVSCFHNGTASEPRTHAQSKTTRLSRSGQ